MSCITWRIIRSAEKGKDMAETEKKVSELTRADLGRTVRYAPDEDTRDKGVIKSVGHYDGTTLLDLDGTSHQVPDPDVTVTFLD